MKKILLLSLFCLACIATACAQTLSGKITLKGSDSYPLATIRIPDLGIGTTAKIDGTYYVGDIKPGKHHVEYSFIGFKTVKMDITFGDGEQMTQDIVMDEAPIMLDAVFVTPDGSDPTQYILKKVWANAEKKYKTVSTFGAETSTVLSFRDFDIISEFMPSTTKSVLMFAAGLVGYKKVLKLIFDHPELDVTTANRVSFAGGKYKWGKEIVKRCNTTLNDKEKDALNKLTCHDNLYEMVYKENLFRNKKAKLRLKGSYQDGDNFIYILEATKGKEKATMYVIDDKWDVKKYVSDMGGLEERYELRKAVGNLYMPVSLNVTFTAMKMSFEEMKKMVEKEDSELSDKEKKKLDKKREEFEKKLSNNDAKRERVTKIAERIGNRGIDCSVNYGVTIKYKKI